MANKELAVIMDGARSDSKTDMKSLVKHLFPDFFELHGDRVSGDDAAIIAGFATIDQMSVAVIATNKGQGLKERLSTNFGSPLPEGYRKALRIMKTAERLRIPIVTLINTPGAYPGADAEKNGQGQIIARSISEMLQLRVPILTVIIGEAGSGGALAIACSDEIWMLEHSMYTVLSPEGFASIMWKDSKLAHRAAELMHIEPQWLKEQGIIERVLPESVLADDAVKLRQAIAQKLTVFSEVGLSELLQKRKQRFRRF